MILDSCPTPGKLQMITNRISKAIQQQDWTTFLIELVLVIAGVLIALQLDQWKEARAEDAQEIEFLKKVRNDIETDIIDLGDSVETLTAVSRFGYTAMALLEGNSCIDQCWPELVAFFHASQWIDVELNRASYEEIRRTGLPRDAALRNKLAMYYNQGVQARKISSDLPRFRELIRSTIPARTQEHLWAECFRIVGRKQSLIGDCVPPQEGAHGREVIARLRANSEIHSSLNYWLSTVSIVKSTLHNQVSEAETVIEALSSFVENRQ